MKSFFCTVLCTLGFWAAAETTVQSVVVAEEGDSNRKVSVKVDVVLPEKKEAAPSAEAKVSSLPWVVAVSDFVTIDSIAIDDIQVVNKPIVVPELSTLTDADRRSAHSVMLGFVLLAEAHDSSRTNTANRMAQIQDNDFARAKALTDYEKKIRSGIRNVVIGGDMLSAELASRPEVFNLADKMTFEKAAELLLKKDELQPDYLAELSDNTGVTHIMQGTVSDIRSSSKKFSGYGITTENTIYEADVIIKVLDLKAGKVVYAKSYTGMINITNDNDVVEIINSDNFALVLKDALRQAGADLAAAAVNLDKNTHSRR